MAIWSRLGLSGPAAAAGAAVIVVVVGGAYWVTQNRDAVQLEAEQLSAQETQDNAKSIVQTGDGGAKVITEPEKPQSLAVAEATKEPPPDPELEAPKQEAPGQEADVPAIVAPAFDVVQVAPDGGGVIAGTAEPGQQVLFMLDGAEIARGTADAAGKFGVLLDFPASDAPRALSIVTELADGTKVPSEGTVLISPFQIAKPEPKEEIATLQTEPEVESVPEQVAEVEPVADKTPTPEVVAQVSPTPTPTPEPTQAPDAPAVVLADNTGITVLQPAPQPTAPQTKADAPVVANVVIDTITYNDEGEVALAGRGASQGFVRVYLNDRPIKTTRIAENGAWEAPLPDVDAGVYRLRVDEVDESGTVTSRVETPFQREAPEIVAAAPQTATAVTVQPGFTLWAIARERFGAGDQYVRVYEANRDLIRDPDLIYPGQVFTLPEG